MASPSVTVVTSNNTILGEGPHWDELEGVLYYTDIVGKNVFRFDPATKKQTSLTFDGSVSFITPVKGQQGKFVMSVGRDLCLLKWDGESAEPAGLEVLATIDDEEGKRGNQINDGKADATGRIWAGSLCFYDGLKIKEKNSAFFSFTKGRAVTKHVSEISCSNGIAFSKDNKTLFYIDSVTKKVDAFDFDIQSGKISNRRTAFDFEANGVPGLPDGMTIDTDDKLWVACALGSRVIQVDPSTGKLLRSVLLPSPCITSVAFGGKNLDELYITSGVWGMSDEEKAKNPTAGRVYHVTGVGAKGFPMYRAVL